MPRKKSVKVKVGVVQATVTPGPDGELGTADDVVTLGKPDPAMDDPAMDDIPFDLPAEPHNLSKPDPAMDDTEGSLPIDPPAEPYILTAKGGKYENAPYSFPFPPPFEATPDHQRTRNAACQLVENKGYPTAMASQEPGRHRIAYGGEQCATLCLQVGTPVIFIGICYVTQVHREGYFVVEDTDDLANWVLIEYPTAQEALEAASVVVVEGD